MSKHLNTDVPAGASLLPSVLRTLVPVIYALLVKWGVVSWLGIGDVLIENLITALVTIAFYALLRVAERHWSSIGWLLGYAQQPVYVPGEVVSVTSERTPPVTTTEVISDPDDGK